MTREELEASWLHLTRGELPALADERGWPVRYDHCFQRILLDNACEGRWYDTIDKRPAYAHASAEVLAKAVALARAVIASETDLDGLNRRSLGWRGKR